MVSGCTKFYLVVQDDGCWAIAHNNNIALDDFYAWNPAVGTDCKGLQPTYYVCIGVGTTPPTPTSTKSSLPGSSKTTSTPTATFPPPPGLTQAGIPANCNKWVMQKANVYCQDMANAAGITLDKLYQLNPALLGNCNGLWPGYAYCVGTA